jgi:phosphoribosylamine---glycine ligase
VEPVTRAMHEEGRAFRGVLYPGLMLTDAGPRVLEFNARMGDPEAQTLLPLLNTDLVAIVEAVIYQHLDTLQVEWSNEACVTVVMASDGYPGTYQTGHVIGGLDDVDPEVDIFFAGVAEQDGALVTSGGRVLSLVARGKTLDEARERAYENVRRISFDGAHYRTDIGAPAE